MLTDEFYAVAFRKKIYLSLEELQSDVDEWIDYYNTQRPHSGRYCNGRTPMQTWNESLYLTKEKMLDTLYQKDISLILTGEAETGFGDDQPARNILSDWNDYGGKKSPNLKTIIPGVDAFENALTR
jgi:Integrase core domain